MDCIFGSIPLFSSKRAKNERNITLDEIIDDVH